MPNKKQPTKAVIPKNQLEAKSNDKSRSNTTKTSSEGPSTSFTLSSEQASVQPSTAETGSADKDKSTLNKGVSDKAASIPKSEMPKSESPKPAVEKVLKTTDKAVKPAASVNKQNSAKESKKLVMLAGTSLAIAVFSCVGLGGLFYWSQLETKALQNRLIEKSEDIAFESANNVRQQLNAVEQKLIAAQQQNKQQTKQKIEQLVASIPTDNQTELETLGEELAKLRQNDPTDWLVHEAEYLARIASRTIWLEHDTTAAINLLQDADARLQETNDPDLLSIRQVIHQDIEQLKLIPRLKTEETILKLMGMTHQVDKLSLAMVYVPESTEMQQDFELTDDAKDWYENLGKSWNKFIADFITVSRRTANVEPLMSPQHQQNLLENLRLKLQVAQWAASAEKGAVYSAALNDIELWLAEYFDMDNDINRQFSNNVIALKDEKISFDYQINLNAIKALRDVIKKNKPQYSAPIVKSAESNNSLSADSEAENSDNLAEDHPTVTSESTAVTDEGGTL